MRGCVGGRDGGYAARPQARLPRPQPDGSAALDRTRSGGGGQPEDENRSPGALPGVPKQLLSPNRCGFAAARGWPDTYLPVPRQTRSRAVWGQCWCVPGRAPSRSMPPSAPSRSMLSIGPCRQQVHAVRRTHLPIPRPGANPARQDAKSRRTRQNAQPVHAVLRPFAGCGSGILLLPPVNARMRVHAHVHAPSASSSASLRLCVKSSPRSTKLATKLTTKPETTHYHSPLTTHHSPLTIHHPCPFRLSNSAFTYGSSHSIATISFCVRRWVLPEL